MSHATSKTAGTLRLSLLMPLLYLGFALTGSGTVLLGAMLPRLSAGWHLRDKDAGSLLLVQFAASALGSLLVREKFLRTLASGYGLIAVGALAVLMLQGRSLPAFGLYGLGLGLAMTSTNMLVGRRYSTRKGAALAVLNFSWSLGAVVCPFLVARFVSHTDSNAAFGLLGLLAAPFALLPLLCLPGDFEVAENLRQTPARRREAKTIVYFAVLGFLYVGIESAAGNWISTYAIRAGSWSFPRSSLAVFSFWAALLLGRAVTPALLALLPERRLYRVSALATAAGIALLLAGHTPQSILAGSVLTGLALAPLFPLIVSLFLVELGDSRNGGWFFAIAGVGGAALSWLTGTLSTAAGSLRIGMMAPAAAVLAMVVMIFWDSSSPQREALPAAQAG